MNEDSRERRRQAKALIVSALRIIRDIGHEYRIKPSEVIYALATLYKQQGSYSAYHWLTHAARQVREDERR
jgi:hypothetical protein